MAGIPPPYRRPSPSASLVPAPAEPAVASAPAAQTSPPAPAPTPPAVSVQRAAPNPPTPSAPAANSGSRQGTWLTSGARAIASRVLQGRYINGARPINRLLAQSRACVPRCTRCERLNRACRVMTGDPAEVFSDKRPGRLCTIVCGNCWRTGNSALCSFVDKDKPGGKGKKRSGPKDEPQKPEEKKPRRGDEGGGGAGVGMNTSMAV